MCGRYTYMFTWAQLHDLMEGLVTEIDAELAPHLKEAPARYNIAPTQPIVILRMQSGKLVPQLVRWGLVPEWVKDPREFPLIVNARAETLREKPSFRHAIKNRRCLIPASGYYEWLRTNDQKVPHYITYADERPMLFAGLYSTWMGPDGEEIDTATIVTVLANENLAKIHDRSPALLEGDDAEAWLDTANVNAERAWKLLQPVPEGETKSVPVSTRVNSARNDGEDLIVPVQEHEGETSGDEASEPSAPKSKGQMDLF